MDTFTKPADPHRPWAAGVEAAGLRWLAAANGARIVAIIEECPDHLILEHLPTVTPAPEHAEAFGQALATTHQAGALSYGSPPPGCTERMTIGAAELIMRPHDSFGSYAAEQLIMPFALTSNLPPAELAEVERLAERLRDGEFDDGLPPARIHGDLWSGNLMWTADGAVLIDPAAHGGHPITDLAMLDLFSCPHLERIHHSYAEAAGLDRGWQELIPLHQIWPLLVHATLFGGGYGPAALAAVRRYR